MVATGQGPPRSSHLPGISQPKSRATRPHSGSRCARPQPRLGARPGEVRPGDQHWAQRASRKDSPVTQSGGQTVRKNKFCQRPGAPAPPTSRALVTLPREPRWLPAHAAGSAFSGL